MSYDIYLRCPCCKEPRKAGEPLTIRGGTYIPGGTREAWLNVTYNYWEHFERVFGENGIRRIYGMTGAESIPLLQSGIDSLVGEPDEDYWAPTEGNARAALVDLLSLAERFPDGVWDGD